MYVSIHLHVQCHVIIPTVLGQYTTTTEWYKFDTNEVYSNATYTASLLYTNECINTYTHKQRGSKRERGSRRGRKERRERERLTLIQLLLRAALAVILVLGSGLSISRISFFASCVTVSHSGDGN